MLKGVVITLKSLIPALVLLWAVSSAQAQIQAESRFDQVPPACGSCPTPTSPGPSCIGDLIGTGLGGWWFPTNANAIGPEENFTFWASNGSPTPDCNDGYLRLIDPSPINIGIVFCDAANPAPGSSPACQNDFLGSWSQYDEVGAICFDFRTFQNDTGQSPPRAAPVPKTITIEGPSGVSAIWSTPTPSDSPTPWITFEAPIKRVGAGWIDPSTNLEPTLADWSLLLSNVNNIIARIELFDNSAINDERNGIDNIILACFFCDEPAIAEEVDDLDVNKFCGPNVAVKTAKKNQLVNDLDVVNNMLDNCN